MRRVKAVNVQRGIRLGVAELLRVLKDFVKRQALVLHPRQDVVTRAVQNAMDRLDVVARQALPENADDRNAAADRRAEVDVNPVRLRRVENLLAVLRKQLLVRRHDALLRIESIKNELLRNARTADRLDDDLDFGIGNRRGRIGRQDLFRDDNAAVCRDVEIRNFLQDDVNAQAPRHHLTVLQKSVRHPGTDGAKAQNAYSDLLHIKPSLGKEVYIVLFMLAFRNCPKPRALLTAW